MTELKEKALMLPQKPGVYIMKDKSGKIIYVGKAKCLPNRVSQYFSNLASHNTKTRRMVSQVHDFDFIIAGSEFESLTLENKLIKQHMPKYNIRLKDDKGYPYIRLGVKDPYPRLSVVSAPGRDGAAYFGPYNGRTIARSIIDALSSSLKLPTCSKTFPRDIGKDRTCLNFDMGRCEGWCRGEPDNDAYLETIKQAGNMLRGNYAEVAEHVKELMEAAAERLEFERAAEYRDRYNSILKLGDRQRLACGELTDMDAVAWSNGPTQGCFTVLHYSGGLLNGRDVLEAENVLDEEESVVLGDLLCRFYLSRGFAPRTILVGVMPEDSGNIERLLSEKSGHKVALTVPKMGEKPAYVRLAQANAAEAAQKARDRDEKRLKALEALGRFLQLREYPRRIEAYDVSNTGGEENVAAMTVFESGKPLKRDYRLFKIKGFEGQDDCASVAEAVTRRFERMRSGSEGFENMPDLMLIDGGRAQVASALEAVRKCGYDVPVFGMVKDDRHRTRALVSAKGEEITIFSIPAVFTLVGTIQEETHRFAIGSHRKARGKAVGATVLTKAEGVGRKRAADLMRHFKSIKAIKEADPDELAAVVPRNVAKAVYDLFHDGGEEEK